jgi:hypothetical protein
MTIGCAVSFVERGAGHGDRGVVADRAFGAAITQTADIATATNNIPIRLAQIGTGSRATSPNRARLDIRLTARKDPGAAPV